MTAKEIMKILKENGWVLDRITGSHHIFKKDGKTVSVPLHGNSDIYPFCKKLLKQAGIKI